MAAVHERFAHITQVANYDELAAGIDDQRLVWVSIDLPRREKVRTKDVRMGGKDIG